MGIWRTASGLVLPSMRGAAPWRFLPCPSCCGQPCACRHCNGATTDACCLLIEFDGFGSSRSSHSPPVTTCDCLNSLWAYYAQQPTPTWPLAEPCQWQAADAPLGSFYISDSLLLDGNITIGPGDGDGEFDVTVDYSGFRFKRTYNDKPNCATFNREAIPFASYLGSGAEGLAWWCDGAAATAYLTSSPGVACPEHAIHTGEPDFRGYTPYCCDELCLETRDEVSAALPEEIEIEFAGLQDWTMGDHPQQFSTFNATPLVLSRVSYTPGRYGADLTIIDGLPIAGAAWAEDIRFRFDMLPSYPNCWPQIEVWTRLDASYSWGMQAEYATALSGCPAGETIPVSYVNLYGHPTSFSGSEVTINDFAVSL